MVYKKRVLTVNQACAVAEALALHWRHGTAVIEAPDSDRVGLPLARIPLYRL